MKVLVIGASGATGRLLVISLLRKNCKVRAVVRNRKAFESVLSYLGLEEISGKNNLEIVEAEISLLKTSDLKVFTSQCDSICSCLGHNLSLRGLYGRPHLLVTRVIKSIVRAVKESSSENDERRGRVKMVLMNSSGVSNSELDEKNSLLHKLVIWLLRVLVPPHRDNEKAANYLQKEIGKNDEKIEWTSVRPDGLVDEALVTDYLEEVSPTRDAIFDAGKVSRINVADFMARLVTEDDLWEKWKGKMPVLYSKVSS